MHWKVFELKNQKHSSLWFDQSQLKFIYIDLALFDVQKVFILPLSNFSSSGSGSGWAQTLDLKMLKWVFYNCATAPDYLITLMSTNYILGITQGTLVEHLKTLPFVIWSMAIKI